MILIETIESVPVCCAECDLCDTYCLLLRRTFKDSDPNNVRLPDCPLLDVYVDEDGILHVVR